MRKQSALFRRVVYICLVLLALWSILHVTHYRWQWHWPVSASASVSLIVSASSVSASGHERRHSSERGLERLLQRKTHHLAVCERLLASDNATVEECESDSGDNSTETRLSSAQYMERSCESLRSEYLVQADWLPMEEQQIAIAFSILLKDNVNQFERLLRAVYRPHHLYCVHVDMKADAQDIAAVRHIASCFTNVHVPSNLVRVDHGRISQLDAELVCMRELLQRGTHWRWFINLTGQEFPLQPMWTLVRILQLLNDTNSVHTCPRWEFPDRKAFMKTVANQHKLVPTVGATHIVVVQDFVRFAADPQNTVSRALHDALATAPSPDECFFNTLNFSPVLRIAGGATAPALEQGTTGFINRLKKWRGLNQFPCLSDHYVRDVCIFGVRDLPFLTDPARTQLFVNKLYWNFQHFALDCLETWFWNRTLTDYLAYWRNGHQPNLNSDFYLQYASQFHVAS